MLFKSRLVIILFCILTAGLLQCIKNLSENDVAHVSPMLDNIMGSIKEGNYEKFSSDFNAEMKNALGEVAFVNMKIMLDQKIGEYQTKKFTKAFQTSKNNRTFVTVIYGARFTKESSEVMITVSTENVDGITKVAGLFFNSPNLR